MEYYPRMRDCCLWHWSFRYNSKRVIGPRLFPYSSLLLTRQSRRGCYFKCLYYDSLWSKLEPDISPTLKLMQLVFIWLCLNCSIIFVKKIHSIHVKLSKPNFNSNFIQLSSASVLGYLVFKLFFLFQRERVHWILNYIGTQSFIKYFYE